jgi:hypothetical protein
VYTVFQLSVKYKKGMGQNILGHDLGFANPGVDKISQIFVGSNLLKLFLSRFLRAYDGA